MWNKMLMWCAWPSFLAACLLEAFVFAFVDPMDLDLIGHGAGVARQGVYTLGFFAFWATSMVSSAISLALAGQFDPQELQ